MAYMLRSGSKTMKEIADELDAKQDTVKKAVYRNQGRFIVLDDGSVGLLERVR
jgi:DNA-binding CsgD family transcriptional regulator